MVLQFQISPKCKKGASLFLSSYVSETSDGLQNSQYRATNKDCYVWWSGSGSSSLIFRLWCPACVSPHFFQPLQSPRAECWGSKQYTPGPVAKQGMETVISWKDSISFTHVSHLVEQFFHWFSATKPLLFSEHDIYYYLFSKQDNLRAKERRLGYRLKQTWFIKNTADISSDLWYSFPSH